jgi:hypothetical protein
MLFLKKNQKKSSAGTLPSKNKRRLGDNFLTQNKNEKGCFLLLTESASSVNKIMYDLLCLTPLSAISWRPVLWWKKPERTTDHGQVTGKLYHLHR